MADTDSTDPKKRARRRLVGAIAFALLAVLILPMVMETEPLTQTREIQVSIPDSEANGFRSRPIMDRVNAPDSADVDSAQASEAEVQELSTPPLVTRIPDEPAPSSPASSVRQATGATASGPAPVATSQNRDIEAERVKAILEGKAGPRSSIGPGFMVQVGAFSEYEKAESLQRELLGKGFPVVVETAGGMSRVRVGPFSTRADAERGEARLSALGRAGVVIAR